MENGFNPGAPQQSKEDIIFGRFFPGGLLVVRAGERESVSRREPARGALHKTRHVNQVVKKDLCFWFWLCKA